MADESSQRRRRRIMVQGLTPSRKQTSAPASQASAPVAPFLVGHGYDIHRLERATGEKPLILAGVVVSDEWAPIAHSDGDVVFHSLVDAILGALGQGDIGQLFPNTDPRWKDASSRVFVEAVCNRARQSGYRISNLDVTLLLERPRIAPLKSEMIESLRSLFDPATIVNLKAGTNEGCDAIGRGEAVAAHAVVLLAAAR
jgi:2-C-methyl-D-erythritol 2,4-cyclodiphosphate synthase